MKKTTRQYTIISISIVLSIALFYPTQYIHQSAEAGICKYDGVNSNVYYEPWGFNARCSDGPPNETLFELGPGIVLGIVSFAIAFLSLSKMASPTRLTPLYQIGFLCGLAFGIDQIFEAIVQNQFGWMYNHMYTAFPYLHIMIMSLTIFTVGTFALDRQILKKEYGIDFSKRIILFGSATLAFISSYHLIYPHDPTMALFLVSLAIGEVTARLTSRSKIQIIHVHENHFHQKNFDLRFHSSFHLSKQKSH